MPKTGAIERVKASRGSIFLEPFGYLWNTHNIAEFTHDKIIIPSQSFQWNGEMNVVQENESIFSPRILEIMITNHFVNYQIDWCFELKLNRPCWVEFVCLFVCNPLNSKIGGYLGISHFLNIWTHPRDTWYYKVEYWALPGSNLPWRPWIALIMWIANNFVI